MTRPLKSFKRQSTRFCFVIATFGCLFLRPIEAAAEPSAALEYYHGVYRQLLEQYAAAKLPEVFPDQLAVVGRVTRPGRVPGIKMTLTKAIEAAGGFATFADRQHVGIWKNAEGRFLVVDERAIERHESDKPDPVLDEGDVVVVISRQM